MNRGKNTFELVSTVLKKNFVQMLRTFKSTMKQRCLFAFFMHSRMCSLNFKFGEIVRPKILTLLDTDNSLPLITFSEDSHRHVSLPTTDDMLHS